MRSIAYRKFFIVLLGSVFIPIMAQIPVVDRKPPKSIKVKYHVVSSGETIYAIAWRYDKNYEQLARNNSILPPYHLVAGQYLNINSAQSSMVSSSAVVIRTKPINKTAIIKKPTLKVVKSTKKQASVPKVTIATNKKWRTNSSWYWPITGNIYRHFSQSKGRKGIDITGHAGDKIKASQSGQVVYAGSHLKTYGKLIIIKHDNTYLSAYGYNKKLLVKEGDTVKAEQFIALMGTDSTGKPLLHFEIRKNGTPINPAKVLMANR